MALPVPGRRRHRPDDRLSAQCQAGQEGSEALLQACPQPGAHPQPARGRDRPPQELSRCATRDEAEGRAVALRPAPAWALAQQPGRAGSPPDQAPDPAHARLSGLLDGEADAGRGGGNGDAGQGTGACRAQGRHAGTARLCTTNFRPCGLRGTKPSSSTPFTANATDPASRSSRVTISTSSGPSASSARRSCVRSVLAPLATSRNTFSAPAAVRAVTCASTLWPSVDTLA